MENKTILYICDKTQCENGHCDTCHHTRDIKYAKNFKHMGDYYIEQEHVKQDNDRLYLKELVELTNIYSKLIESIKYAGYASLIIDDAIKTFKSISRALKNAYDKVELIEVNEDEMD